MYELHVDCTRELLRDVREAGVKRVILASTSGTIAVSKEERVGTEEDDYPIEVVGRWPYYLSKIYEEKLALEYCRKHAIPLVVLNPSLLMGPGDDRLSSTWTVVKFLNGEIPGHARRRHVLRGRARRGGRLRQRAHPGRAVRPPPDGREHVHGGLLRPAGAAHRRARAAAAAALAGERAGRASCWSSGPRSAAPKPTLDPQEVDIGEHLFCLDASKAERELGFHARDSTRRCTTRCSYIYTKMPPGHLPGTKGRLGELREGT